MARPGSTRVDIDVDRREGQRNSRRRIEQPMCDMRLLAHQERRPVPRTTNSRHDLPVAPNLLARNFEDSRPDQVWLADISYLPGGDGWLYLAAIRDMTTCQIVSWSMADHVRAELCIKPLVMVL
jgi:putative transposase